ncbi:MAG: phage tail protein [Azoarcus sp.]|jgi:hypothetical protein|nr:phage tail protein [Azoarcus sp.]
MLSSFGWVNGYGGTLPWSMSRAHEYNDRPTLASSPDIAVGQTSAIATGLITKEFPDIGFLHYRAMATNDRLRVLWYRDSGTLYKVVATHTSTTSFSNYWVYPSSDLGEGNFRLVLEFYRGSSTTAEHGVWILPLEGFPFPDPPMRLPLGIPTVTAGEIAKARVSIPSPFGDFTAQAGGVAQAQASIPWPFGQILALSSAPQGIGGHIPSPLYSRLPRALAAQRRDARVALPSPLGIPSAFALQERQVRVSVPSVLGPLAAIATPPLDAFVNIPSPLAAPHITARIVRLQPAPAVQAAPGLLLSDNLPLRRASDLIAWRDDVVLPWAYGRVTLAPVPLDDAGLEYLIADHPIAGITQVTAAGAPLDGWKLIQRADETGHAVALLRLTQPGNSGDLAVTLTGRQHTGTGAILEHPADIAADVLRQCGCDVPADAFLGLRDAFPGLSLGIVFESETTLADAMASIITPLGAVWHPQKLAAMLRAPGTPVAVLDVISAESISASTGQEIASVARVTFGYDYAVGQARGALTLEAPEAIERYGRISAEIALPAVRRARDALAIGTRRLAEMARPVWEFAISISDANAGIDAGDTITIDHPRMPPGAALVLSAAREYARNTLTLTAWMPAGHDPRVDLAGQGGMIDAARVAENAIVYRDGVATFTVADDAGMPLAGAAVQLDGDEVRHTDRAGRVQFRTERGRHTLYVYMDGYNPFTMDVIV